MYTNICKVLQRLATGDDIVCTTKAVDMQLTEDNYNKLKRDIGNKFSMESEDILYFTVRTTINGDKNNWKCKSFAELDKILRGIFNVS